MKRENKSVVARIDNQLVMKAHYNLSTNEQKLILFLVSKITNPKDDDFNVQRVSIKEIEKFFSKEGKRWGSIYERVNSMCDKITSKKITLPKGFVVDGKSLRMHRYITWFTDIDPYEDENGEICLKFQFSEPLKGFLLQLSEYVRINLIEILPMNGKYSIRMYQIFKAEMDRNKRFRKEVEIEYDLEVLRTILGIEEGKYSRIQNFKDRVLNPLKKEINECSQEIKIDYELLKVKRTVTGIKFIVRDMEEKKKLQIVDYVPSALDIEKLSRSQLFAFNFLVEKKCKEGIAYRQIVSKMPSSEYLGWEDVFIEKAWKRFERVTKHTNQNNKAGAFVNWWINGEFREKLFPELMEEVVGEKKRKKQVELDNREWAKGMTNGEFVIFLKKNN